MNYRCLEDFFKENPKVALAFSGGVDSAYLLAEAIRLGVEVRGYFVKSQFQPEFELEDAKRLSEELGADMVIIEADALGNENICKNPKNRCYYCKGLIFDAITKKAKGDGFDTIIDGTNASDDSSDRPGMRVLEELKVLSPLRLCNMTKDDVRRASKDLGLFTWEKPAYACLATRIPEGTAIDEDKLKRVEAAEDILAKMGFVDFRVRYFGGCARIQVKENQMEKAISNRHEIRRRMKPVFETVLLDLEER